MKRVYRSWPRWLAARAANGVPTASKFCRRQGPRGASCYSRHCSPLTPAPSGWEARRIEAQCRAEETRQTSLPAAAFFAILPPLACAHSQSSTLPPPQNFQGGRVHPYRDRRPSTLNPQGPSDFPGKGPAGVRPVRREAQGRRKELSPDLSLSPTRRVRPRPQHPAGGPHLRTPRPSLRGTHQMRRLRMAGPLPHRNEVTRHRCRELI